jgi:predicted phosphodiesterase
MRFAIISDVHSNLEALNSVLERIDSIGVDNIICLGDMVGYNADPDRCVELIRKRDIKSVLGNHDSRVCGFEEPDDFNPVARTALLWTRRNITDDNLEYLKTLPRRLTFNDDALAVHGWVNNTDMYILSQSDAMTNFKLLEMEELYRLCFFGHTHIRVTYAMKEMATFSTMEESVRLLAETYYLINPGSVGQPRDYDPRASFLIYNTEEREVRFFRTDYDVDKCRSKIVKAGLPNSLAERLIIGY